MKYVSIAIGSATYKYEGSKFLVILGMSPNLSTPLVGNFGAVEKVSGGNGFNNAQPLAVYAWTQTGGISLVLNKTLMANGESLNCTGIIASLNGITAVEVDTLQEAVSLL